MGWWILNNDVPITITETPPHLGTPQVLCIWLRSWVLKLRQMMLWHSDWGILFLLTSGGWDDGSSIMLLPHHTCPQAGLSLFTIQNQNEFGQILSPCWRLPYTKYAMTQWLRFHIHEWSPYSLQKYSMCLTSSISGGSRAVWSSIMLLPHHLSIVGTPRIIERVWGTNLIVQKNLSNSQGDLALAQIPNNTYHLWLTSTTVHFN